MFPTFEIEESKPEPELAKAEPVYDLKQIKVPIAGTGWAPKPICNNLNCKMCYTQYATKTMKVERQDAQANAPVEARNAALNSLKLTSDDVFADIGCGDGNVLIAAVGQYGVREAVGFEIDKAKVDEARLNVARAGMESRIQIVHADATKIDLSDYGITAAYVYLYPDVSAKLDLSQINRVASVYHKIPNLTMQQVGQNYLAYQTQSTAVEQARTGYWAQRCIRNARGKVIRCERVWVWN